MTVARSTAPASAASRSRRDAAIEFPDGLIGLDSRRFTLVARSDGRRVPVAALARRSGARAAASPTRGGSSPTSSWSSPTASRAARAPRRDDALDVYVTVRASERLEDFTANLRAPLLIAGGRGHQVINQAPDAPCARRCSASRPRTSAA